MATYHAARLLVAGLFWALLSSMAFAQDSMDCVEPERLDHRDVDWLDPGEFEVVFQNNCDWPVVVAYWTNSGDICERYSLAPWMLFIPPGEDDGYDSDMEGLHHKWCAEAAEEAHRDYNSCPSIISECRISRR